MKTQLQRFDCEVHNLKDKVTYAAQKYLTTGMDCLQSHDGAVYFQPLISSYLDKKRRKKIFKGGDFSTREIWEKQKRDNPFPLTTQFLPVPVILAIDIRYKNILVFLAKLFSNSFIRKKKKESVNQKILKGLKKLILLSRFLLKVSIKANLMN